MQLSQLLDGIEVTGLKEGSYGEVHSVHYDSRRCEKGSLFVAIPGLKTDGHQFIEDALARGARFVVHEKEFHPPDGITAIRVPDTRQVLGRLGKNFFGHPSALLCLIAVVGTNGKTTVTYLLESILRAAGHSVGVLGTVNYRYGDKTLPAPNTTPESFDMQRVLREMLDHGVTHCLTEVSSHAIDLHRVDECSFDLGIFTNLTQDHLDYHRNMETYFQAKKRFFSEVLPGGKHRLRAMILNGDDHYGQRIIREVEGGRMTYGFERRCDVHPSRFHLTLEGIDATLDIEGASFDIVSPLMGRLNLYNILASVAAAVALGVPKPFIREGLGGLARIPGRLEKVSTAGQPAVFVDYAHTDDALKRVLQDLALFRKARIITVFGCGGDRDRGKRPLMGGVVAAYSDLSILTSDNPRSEDPLEIIREIEQGVTVPRLEAVDDLKALPDAKGYLVLPDRREAIAKAIDLAGPADIVLVAGKGHEDYQVIGSRRTPFDDRVVAREELAHWQTGRGGA